MSIFSKLFGSQSIEKQKNKIFQEFEKRFEGEMLNYTKASWLTSRGNHYGQQGKFDQAITDFKEAIKLKPDHAPSYIALGIAYREKGMLQEALKTFNKTPRKMIILGEEIYGFEFDLYNAIASVYLLFGDKLKTIEYAKKALEAVDDPRRKEQIKFAKQTNVISKNESDDLHMIKILKELIKELE